jgi:hypothetical protein
MVVTTTNAYITLYGWPDHSLAGNSIALPNSLHSADGEMSAYSGLITFASASRKTRCLKGRKDTSVIMRQNSLSAAAFLSTSLKGI